jgi:thiamine-monophosphate kinase
MFENKDNSATSIANLGEFGLIDHLTKNFKIRQKSTVKGIGDDAAVISCNSKKRIGCYNRSTIGRRAF